MKNLRRLSRVRRPPNMQKLDGLLGEVRKGDTRSIEHSVK
jgi:hypothetical protein